MVSYNSEIEKSGLGTGMNLEIEDAGEHELLLTGLLAAIRLSFAAIHSGDARNEDTDHLIKVVDLIEALIPGEYGLQRAFGGKE